jgi:hypothetical protein
MEFHNIDKLQNMMIQILDEGEKNTWSDIEKEKDAFKRCELSSIYQPAVDKIRSGK